MSTASDYQGRGDAPKASPEYADALKTGCGLPGCAVPPGELCVNSVTGEGPRELPHWNRVIKARRS